MGCSGADKTTVATALKDLLVKEHDKRVHRLDGDDLCTELNRDLTFSKTDGVESVRRTGKIATLFADLDVIALVVFIGPCRGDKDGVRKRHEQ